MKEIDRITGIIKKFIRELEKEGIEIIKVFLFVCG